MDHLSLTDISTRAPSLIPTALQNHASAPRLQTSSVITNALRGFYPNLHLTVSPCVQTDLIGFARDGHASLTKVSPETFIRKCFVQGVTRVSQAHPIVPAARDGEKGEAGGKGKNDGKEEVQIVEDLEYAKFLYTWEGNEFLVFIVDGVDGSRGCPEKNNYILAKRPEGWTVKDGPDSAVTYALMVKVAERMMEMREYVLVFDDARWKKNQKLWEVTQRASWENVVLDKEMKEGLRQDVEGFFESRDFYAGYGVPWKRGIIFHGSPGNGKTLAIQSLMKGLYSRPEPIPTLYVKSFAAQQGAQWSIRQIFTKARQMAPCLLIFEDIDSMITDKIRSYFLNEVDGLESNDGILMLGTTNHLDKLDPALAQRPSRFDRKIHFDRPNKEERQMYAQFWAKSIPGTNSRNFPDTLCEAIGDVTDGFSFAYLKELFIATLLGMAREGVTLESSESPTPLSEDAVIVSKPSSTAGKDKEGDGAGPEEVKEKTYPELERSVLWPRIKAQADILRTAIVSEEATGQSAAAVGEKGFDDDGELDVEDRVRMMGMAGLRRGRPYRG